MMLPAGRHRAVGPALACLHAAGSSVDWHGSAELPSTSGRLSAMMPSVSDPRLGVMATLSQLYTPGWVMDRGFASSAVAANIAAAQTQSTATPTTPQPGRPSRGALRPKEPYPLQKGHVYEATVTAVRKSLAELDVALPGPSGGDPSVVRAILPRSLFTQGVVEDMSTVLKVGEKIKVLAVGPSHNGRQVRASTKHLEPQPGAMLTDKQAVFAGAEKRAEEYRAQGAQMKAQRQAFQDSAKVGDVVQARYYMTLGGSNHLVAIDGKHLFRVDSKALQSLQPLTKGQMIQLVVKTKINGEPRFAALQPTSQTA